MGGEKSTQIVGSWLVISITTASYSRASTTSALSNTPHPHHSNPPRNPFRGPAHHHSSTLQYSAYRGARDHRRWHHYYSCAAAQAFRYASKSRLRLRPAQEAKAKKLAEVIPSPICDVSCQRQQQNSTTRRSRLSRFDPGRPVMMKTRRG